jgi:ubiquitin-protein ligase
MTARLRRLHADHEEVKGLFGTHPYIRLVGAEGVPPEKYVFSFSVSGLVARAGDTFEPGDQHMAELFLPIDYPRRPPFCRMITPVFHPNIDPQKICIGDHWSAGQSLGLMAVRIAEMICYQSYNLKNAAAAAWAEQNIQSLPLLSADLSVGL